MNQKSIIDRRIDRRQILALFLSLVMLFVVPLEAFAVSGSEVAVNGTYTSTIYAVKKSDSKSTTMKVTVADGQISGISFSGGSASDFTKYLITKTYGSPAQNEVSAYIGQSASVDSIDALSGASRNTSTKYRMDLKSAIIEALQQATDTGEDGIVPDGDYTLSVTCYKKNKSATINVTVTDWVISDISFSGSDASDFKKYLITNTYGDPKQNEISTYLGVEASQDGVDAVSSASRNSSSSYDCDLPGTIKEALKTAEARTELDADVVDGTYYGTSKTMDNGHWIEVAVGVENGKISALDIVHADGSWDNLVNTVKSSYVGKSAAEERVDAVSSATTQGYKAAIKEAVGNAIRDGGTSERSVQKTDAVDSTCVVNGTVEYYTCSVCGRHFSDEACTEELSDEDMVKELADHILTKQAAVNSTCVKDGKIGHYKCDVCGKLFVDPEAKVQITDDNAVITSSGHVLTKVKATAAGCETAGVKEHYKCTVCGSLFSDATGLEETTKAALTIKPTGHSWDSGKVTKKPTTTSTGVMTYTCKNDSSHKKTATIAKLRAPAAPVISTEGSVSSKTIDVYWNKVKNATGYIVAYKLASASKWTTKTLGNTDYFTMKKLKNGGMYDVKVAAISSDNGTKVTGNYSSAARRYIAGTRLVKAAAAKKAFKAQWKKKSGASGYDLIYAENKTLKRNRKTTAVKGAAKTSVSIKKLQSGTTLYCAARPYKQYKGIKYNGVQCSPKAVKIK